MFDVVEPLHGRRRLPGLGCGVDAVDGHEVGFVAAAAVAPTARAVRSALCCPLFAARAVRSAHGGRRYRGPVRWIRVSAAAALLAGCAGDSAGSGSTVASVVPPQTMSAPSGPTTPAVVPEGFSPVVIKVARPDGTTESYCVWLAETPEQRQQGLMNVTSLGGADGMLFRFNGEQTSSFWMKDTLLPLSIAFYAGDGVYVSATDMEPCAADVAACPAYSAESPYADALEVPQGRLSTLGIGPESRLTVTGTACSPSG